MFSRSADNIVLSDTCPHCHRRIWFQGDQSSDRKYYAPKWFRDMFTELLGVYQLGSYRIVKCEVCGRSLSVFDNGRGQFYDEVNVFYACSLLSIPLESEEFDCNSARNCYNCPLKGSESYVERK